MLMKNKPSNMNQWVNTQKAGGTMAHVTAIDNPPVITARIKGGRIKQTMSSPAKVGSVPNKKGFKPIPGKVFATFNGKRV